MYGEQRDSHGANLGGAAALPSHAYAGGVRASSSVQIKPDFAVSVSPTLPQSKRQNLSASPAWSTCMQQRLPEWIRGTTIGTQLSTTGRCNAHRVCVHYFFCPCALNLPVLTDLQIAQVERGSGETMVPSAPGVSPSRKMAYSRPKSVVEHKNEGIPEGMLYYYTHVMIYICC
jgi:hypothetical protein